MLNEQLLSYNSTPIVPVVKYAGFWIRAVAGTLDLIIFAIFWTFIFVISSVAFIFTAATIHLFFFSSFLIVFFIFGYSVFMITKYQATLGQMTMGLRVERTNGDRITLGYACLRELLGKLVLTITLGIGFLMVVWIQKKQGLNDKIADTVVIEKDPSKSKTIRMVFGIITMSILLIFLGLFLAPSFSNDLHAKDGSEYEALKKSIFTSLALDGRYCSSDEENGGCSGFCKREDGFGSTLMKKTLISPVCNDNAKWWVASEFLGKGRYICSDSRGIFITIDHSISTNETSCGVVSTSTQQ
ncbi:RDD family protein [Candidatus Kaiserbacteria bacterium]|nr:RDD family protein [Candidatus Kaiserbacteria bacterium]